MNMRRPVNVERGEDKIKKQVKRNTKQDVMSRVKRTVE